MKYCYVGPSGHSEIPENTVTCEKPKPPPVNAKTVALFLLLTGQRGQTIQLIDLRNVTITKNMIKVRFRDLLKTTRPGYQQKELSIKVYAPDRRLCIVTVLNEYLEKTKSLRKGTSLFISTVKPHGRVARDTITRWFRCVMEKAGVDTSVFKPHSVRAASTNAAVRAKIPLHTILETAGWTQDNTFRKYYEKPVVKSCGFDSLLEQR